MDNNNKKILSGVIAIWLAGFALASSLTIGHFVGLAISNALLG